MFPHRLYHNPLWAPTMEAAPVALGAQSPLVLPINPAKVKWFVRLSRLARASMPRSANPSPMRSTWKPLRDRIASRVFFHENRPQLANVSPASNALAIAIKVASSQFVSVLRLVNPAPLPEKAPSRLIPFSLLVRTAPGNCASDRVPLSCAVGTAPSKLLAE